MKLAPFVRSLRPCPPRLLAAIALPGLLGSAHLPAAEALPPPPPSPVPVDSVVAEALSRNPELRFYEAEIAAARAGRRSAGLLPNPEMGGTIGPKTVSGNGPEGEGIAWSVSILQPFEWPGRISLRKAIANQDLQLAELGLDRFKSALAGRIRSLAFRVHAARAKAAAAAEVADRFRDLREVLVQRDPAGLTPLLETRVIEATELNAQRRTTEAQQRVRAALLELNALRGAPLEAPLELTPPTPGFAPIDDAVALLARARTNNFELRARSLELAQQGLRVDLARNERYPALRLGPTYSEERVGNDVERIAALGLSVPLPLWNRNRENIAAAVARQTQAEVALTVARRDLERRVIEAATAYEARRREMAGWRPDAVDHFREAAALADRHYRLGAVPIATYVELQKQYLDAVEALLETRQEALEAASELQLLTGIDLPLTTAAPSATPAP